MSVKDDYLRKIHGATNISPRPPFPSKLKVDLCNVCNYSCVTCPTAFQDNKKKHGVIDDSLCRSIILQGYELGARELAFSATGEPLLNKNLESYAFLSKKIGYEYVFTNTNGLLLDEKRAETLVNCGLDSIKFSINAGTSDNYALFHGVDGFDKVIANFKNFIRLRREVNSKIRVSVSFCTVKPLAHEPEILREILGDFDGDLIVFNANARGGWNVDERLCLGSDDFSFSFPCSQLFGTCVTTAEGYLVACCQDFDKMTVMADLNITPLKEAWNSDKFVEFRQRYLAGNIKESICDSCLNGTQISSEIKPISPEYAYYEKSDRNTKDVMARTEKMLEVKK